MNAAHRHNRWRALVWLALLALHSGLNAQAGPVSLPCPFHHADPVEGLRHALRAPAADAAAREQQLHAALAELHGLGDIQRALDLSEWRDRDRTFPWQAVDQRLRQGLEEHFVLSFREVCLRKDPTLVLAALGVLGELTRTEAQQDRASGLVVALTADLVLLTRQGTPAARAAAARLLGQVDPDPSQTLPALVELLRCPDLVVRQTAAEVLGDWLQRTLASAGLGEMAVEKATTSRSRAIQVTAGILPEMGAGLGDWHPAVRRRCLRVSVQAAGLLIRVLSTPEDLAKQAATSAAQRALLGAERAELRPLIVALGNQGQALARCLLDSDMGNRLQAQKSLELLAQARSRWLHQTEAETPEERSVDDKDDPLLAGLQAGLPVLTEALGNPEVRIRRAVLDVLELLGPVAAPVSTGLVKALNDPDRFVRWSAIRTLRAIGPEALEAALPRLIQLLEDRDPDISISAAAALEQAHARVQPEHRQVTAYAQVRSFDGVTRTAIPALIRSLRCSTVEVRLASIRTLKGLGAEAQPAVRALCETLRDPDVRVRQAAAEALGGLGPAAREAADDLRLALQDPNPEVQKAVSSALLRVLQARIGD